MFEYKATVISVYDADTITASIDLGFYHTYTKVKLRLLGIDAPEVNRGTEADKLRGRRARDFLREKILGKEIIVKTHKDKAGKYGRWLAEIYPLSDKELTSYNQLLVDEGHAVARTY